jgi:flagellar hook-length control protein FliK
MKPLAQQSQQPQPSAADRAPPAPFESMLDDSTQAATPPPKPTASAPSQRDTRSEASKQASNSKDTKSTKAGGRAEGEKTDKSAKGDKSGKTDKADAAADAAPDTKGDGDAKNDAKTDAKTDAKNDAKTDAQAVAADTLTTAATGTPTGVDPVATALPATAAVPASVTVDATLAIAADGAGAAIPVAAVATTLAPAIAATAAAATKAAPATEPGKADAEDKLALLAAQGDAEPPSAGTKASKKAVASAEGKPINPDDKQDAAPAHADAGHATVNAQPAAGAAPTATLRAGADAVQPLAINASAQNAAAPASPAAASAAQLAQQLAPQAVPLAAVAFEIASKAVAGKNHFDIRLDPPDLGRIEVRLDVGRDGSISSHLIADRKDTLDLLQRDASSLQRAFEDAGLKTSDQGMQFSLRDHSAGQQQHTPNAVTAQIVVKDETPIETLPVTYSRLAGSGGGLDIRV